MKQKNLKPLTKEELIEILKDFPGKKDVEAIVKKTVQQQLKNHPTKYELHVELINQELRFEDKAREYRDQVLTKMDQTMSELAQHREDKLFTDYEIKKLKEKDEELEGRISKFEHS